MKVKSFWKILAVVSLVASITDLVINFTALCNEEL